MSQTATHLLNAMWLGTQSLYWLQEFQNNTEKNELINLNNPSENADSFSETLHFLSHAQLSMKEQETET